MGDHRCTYEVTVEAAFDISGQGAAVVFTGRLDGVPAGRRLMVVATPPSTPSFPAQATVEFALYAQPHRHERHALLVAGRLKEQLPPGTRLVLSGPNAGMPVVPLDAVVGEINGLDLPAGWRLLASTYFDEELKHELPPGHLLFGVPTQAVARHDGSDDVLFATQLWGAPFVKVHLTYRAETDPGWPIATAYNSGEHWVATEPPNEPE